MTQPDDKAARSSKAPPTKRDQGQIEAAKRIIDSSYDFAMEWMERDLASTHGGAFEVMHQLRHSLRDLYRIVNETPRSAIAAPTDEEGWLIEVKHNDLTMWWAGGELPWQNFGEPTWTRDAFKAVRFCRQQDGERAFLDWPAWMRKEVKVVAHGFMAATDGRGVEK